MPIIIPQIKEPQIITAHMVDNSWLVTHSHHCNTSATEPQVLDTKQLTTTAALLRIYYLDNRTVTSMYYAAPEDITILRGNLTL